MHPIEHLRYLAGASRVDDDTLVSEAAYALGMMPDDRAMLVVVCRRLIERHPTCGPLWWLCSEVLTAPQPSMKAWEAMERYSADNTLDHLAAVPGANQTVAVTGWGDPVDVFTSNRPDLVLTDEPAEADVVVVDAVAVSPAQVIVDTADAALIEASIPDQHRVLIARLGTRLAAPVVEEIVRRAVDTTGSVFVSVDPTRFHKIVTTDGVIDAAQPGGFGADGSFAPELLVDTTGT